MPKKTNDPLVTRSILKSELKKGLKKEFDKRIKSLATKKELKEAVKKLVTRDEFNGLVDEVLDLKDDMAYLKENMSTKEDSEKIIKLLDQQAKQWQDLDRNYYINRERVNEMEPKIENHEKRISVLELNS